RSVDESTSNAKTARTLDYKMGMFRSLPLLSLAIWCALATGSLPGGWTTKEPNSEAIFTDLAHYAVSSQVAGKEFYDTVLELLGVETQVVAGRNYRLNFSTAETACKVGEVQYSKENCLPKENMAKDNCTAVVYERPWENHREVTSFNCANQTTTTN
ncbi:unnamed protein product, partial [Ixodes hexagonus]